MGYVTGAVYNRIVLSSDILNPLLKAAYRREITWLEASNRHSLAEFIDTFYNMRKRSQESLEGMNDAQVAFASRAHSVWSVSESITHLIYTQGFYINKLLNIATSTMPHMAEAARGFGEGAQTGVSAGELRTRLATATAQVRSAIEGTRNSYDLERTEANEFFGLCNYSTWMLLLLAHEVDHLHQIVAMRRLARTEGA